MIHSHRFSLAIGMTLQCVSCMIVPRMTETYDPDCRLTNRRIVLDVEQVKVFPGPCSDNRARAGILVVLGIVGAGSAVVSGSIAVVGNVVYWVEHKASCAAAQDPTQQAKPAAESVSAGTPQTVGASEQHRTLDLTALSVVGEVGPFAQAERKRKAP
jgi:hypothetical protein